MGAAKIELLILELQFLLIPIRDWNPSAKEELVSLARLQFLLIPIRDWNSIWDTTFNQLPIAISTNPY